MVDIRGFNGGINTDASPELLPNGDYTYAMNIENTAEGIVNLPGNIAIGNTIQSPGGEEWICGAHFDKKRQRVYYFTNNPTGSHRIMSHDITTSITTELFVDSPNPIDTVAFTGGIQFVSGTPLSTITVQSVLSIATGTSVIITGSSSNNSTFPILNFYTTATTTVIQVSGTVVNETATCTISYDTYSDSSSILRWKSLSRFDANYLIKDIKVIHRNYEGDLIYFVDPNKKLLFFNYESLRIKKYGPSNTLDYEYFSVLKGPPVIPISCKIEDETSFKTNTIQKKLFQFKYRYVYDDNEKSVWSAISKIPLPQQTNRTEYYLRGGVQNCIDLDYFSGDINVAKIEIAARVNIENTWSDFFLIDTIDKVTFGVGSNSLEKYRFRNDGVYLPIDVQESNLLFDYVPDKSNALELANGNTLVVGGVEDGYDRALQPKTNTLSTAFDAEVISYDYSPPSLASTLVFQLRNDDDTGPWVKVKPNPSSPLGLGIQVRAESTEVSPSSTGGIVKFTGTPVKGDTITITHDTYWYKIGGLPSDSSKLGYPRLEIFTVVVEAGWTITDIINAFVNYTLGDKWNKPFSTVNPLPTKIFNTGPIPNALYIGNYMTPGTRPIGRGIFYYGLSVSISNSAVVSDADSLTCYKWLGHYKFGLVYYDKFGKTNGVYTSSSISNVNDKMILRGNPYKRPTPTDPPTLTGATLKINHLPPAWAEYYHVVRTRELSSDFSLMVIASDFQLNPAGSPTSFRIDIQNILDNNKAFPSSSSIINYSFVRGDRLRILEKFSATSPIANTTGDFLDFEIINVEDIEVTIGSTKVKRRNIIVPSVGVLDREIDGQTINNGDKLLIEIYRPSKGVSDESLFYYEIGYTFPVYDVNGVKYHSANHVVQSPTSASAEIELIDDGDYYLKNRTMLVGNDLTTFGASYVVDKNFSEFWSSGVWSQGRPLVVDNSIKKEYYPAMLRFSQSYIYGTNINNTNRFYPLNFEEADASYGDILRLKTRENFIRMFQRHKVGMIPIYRQIIVDNAASSQVALSERLLNKPNYYSGDYGIDKYGSSLVSTDYGDYFVDTLNKAIIRVSLDGITNVSDTNNLMSWSNDNIFEDSYGYGCFNYENRNVIMLIGRLTTANNFPVNVNKIVAYNEPKKKFESFYSYTSAEAILFINGLIYTLLGNKQSIGTQGKEVYRHDSQTRNNFYGFSENSRIDTVFNGNLQMKKTYTAIEQLSSSIWDAVINTGPLTNQMTTVTVADYEKTVGNPPFVFTLSNKLENKFNATIKRNMNNGGNKNFGDTMKGLYAQVELTNISPSKEKLISISLKYIDSPLTNR